MTSTPASADGSRHGERVLSAAGLGAVVAELQERGHEVIAPTVRDGVIALDVVGSVDDLPLGWGDEQSGGRYRLVRRDDGARFGYAVGPRSGKDLLHPARVQLLTMTRTDGRLEVEMHEPEPVRRAVVGLRPCELAAMAKQDGILRDGPHPDPVYGAGRSDLFVVAVDCGVPAATCFCPSMGTGPGAGPGYDLALTELVGDDPTGADDRYVARIGSDRGAELIAGIDAAEASPDDLAAARLVVERAEAAITRRLETDGIRDLLYDNLESGQWDDIATRCLSCGNCTLVCPTCFCTDIEHRTDLAGDTSTRWRVWDSCFSAEFSRLGPEPVRASIASRYRQWLVHKVASWHDQFGESGCVGCGRCITWCPVGIDLTEELATMRAVTP